MAKRKVVDTSSSEEDDYNPRRAPPSSPDKPLGQVSRRTGKKARKASDDDSESESEEERVKPAKKTKAKVAKPSIKKPKKVAQEDEDIDTGDVKVGVNASGDRFVDLGKKRRATVNTFKGGKFLDIREFYGDEDDLKPGKKGISITQEQWETLKKGSDVIDSFFARISK